MAQEPSRSLLQRHRAAREADRVTREARSRLVTAVRQAHSDGTPQAEIARHTGRCQPEVSRLIRFHGSTSLARRLRAHRRDVIRAVREAGGARVRALGSVATGKDHEGYDVDLLFHMDQPLGLLALSRLELSLEAVLGAEADLVPDTAVPPFMRSRVMSEATPL